MPQPAPQRRTPSAPQGPRSVGGLAPLLIVGLLLAGLAGGWLLYARSVARARLEAQQSRAVEEACAAATAALLAERAKAQASGAAAGQGAAGTADAAPRERVVDDPDGKLLWASPTAGEPISLAYVSAGTQCLIYLRPAKLATDGEGAKVLAALGPWGESAVARLNALAGMDVADVDALVIAVVVRADGALDACVRFELREAWSNEELLARFPDARLLKEGTPGAIANGERAWFLASSADGAARRTLVACPADLAAELIESDGEPPLLARDIESLVAQSDADRTATVIVGAKFLQAGGVHLLEGEAEPVREAVAWLLGDEAAAAALSVNWGESFFIELRAAPALNASPRWLATTLRAKVSDAAERLAPVIESQAWPEYGRAVLARFPAMMAKLASYSRGGEAERHAVVRAYLPAAAGHNLLMGAELLLTQAAPSDAQHAHADPSTDSGQAVGMAPKRGIEEKLATVTSLSFPKETLQRALELLAEDVGVPIAIDGPALRAEGITQNQSLTLELRDRPAGEILVEILRLANPDRTATGPADLRQKLVFVVEPAAGGGGRMIVTTRATAAKSGAALPAVFGGSAE